MGGNQYRFRQYCPADFNRDDIVDEADLAAYVECWQIGDETSIRRADMNRDETIDGADMTEFLSAYFNNDCDPQRQKTMRSRMAPEGTRRVAWRERGGAAGETPRRSLETLQQVPPP